MAYKKQYLVWKNVFKKWHVYSLIQVVVNFSQRQVHELTVCQFLEKFLAFLFQLSIVWLKAILNGAYICFPQSLVLLH